ncbi:MAG: Phosphoglycolate phosphatase [Fimbriimonadaceae bacterium]|nr:Phosphoglycolate phosphatase [Fimbriimonadaceae bacterium]
MGKIKAVSLDCAGTLLRIDWQPSAFAVGIVEELGFEVDRPDARSRYDAILRRRWPDYLRLNLTKDQLACQGFWEEVTAEWISDLSIPDGRLTDILEHADARLFGPFQTHFSPYCDVLPALEALRAAGLRLAILSNWDVTLHRAISITDLAGYFEFAIASLEEGVEKPDPAIFQIMMDRFGLTVDEVIHVGDDLIDDYRGAKGVGMKAFHLDRRSTKSEGFRLARLTDLLEAIRSLD